jgi:membrane protein YdbS with pleckstrin-like domain
MSTTEENLQRRARSIVRAKNIYKAVVVFWVLAMAIQVLVWWLTTPTGYFWPVWPILGLIVATVVAGVIIYGGAPFRVREDQVARELARLRATQAK